MDVDVRERIVAETRGNPLALLELTRGLTPAELAGGFGLPDARPLAKHRPSPLSSAIAASWPGWATRRAPAVVVRSHSRAVPSSLPVRSRVPSAPKQTLRTIPRKG